MLSKLSLCSRSNGFKVDYDIKEKIGQGAFSDVWLCVQRKSGQEYAAKILKKDYGKTIDESTWNNISEINVTNSVEMHPFLLLVEFAYHEQDSGNVILVSELMNKSLYDIIEKGECPLSDSHIKIYMYQMLEGLKYLHENGFIHRDIKPENILLKSRILKIADFGTTCNVANGQPYTEYVATRWYRAPECLLTRGWYGTKMDIWAAGCVLYEMATGCALFEGNDENDQMEKIDQVLGSPDYRLCNKFKKHKSDVFVNRYELKKQNQQISSGVGLHTKYQPFKPAYELFKDMIVYDPVKRFSADRLLRKMYFYEMRHSRYEHKIKEFAELQRKKSINNLSMGNDNILTATVINTNSTVPSLNKKGAGGDRTPHMQPIKAVQNKNIDESIKNINLELGTASSDASKQRQRKISPKKSQNKGINIQKSEQIYPDKQKENPRNITCSKTSTKNTLTIRKQLASSSISTFPRVSTTKNVKNSLMNRPPFK